MLTTCSSFFRYGKNDDIMLLLQNSDNLELLNIQHCMLIDINGLVGYAKQAYTDRTSRIMLKMTVDY